MIHLRSVITAIAVFLVATPLLAQGSPRIAGDTSARRESAAMVSVAPANAVANQMRSQDAIPLWVNAVSATPAITAHAMSVDDMGNDKTKQNVAMMIVGGAGIIGGAIIGGKAGTVVTIGGAAVALVGFWRYLK